MRAGPSCRARRWCFPDRKGCPKPPPPQTMDRTHLPIYRYVARPSMRPRRTWRFGRRRKSAAELVVGACDEDRTVRFQQEAEPTVEAGDLLADATASQSRCKFAI